MPPHSFKACRPGGTASRAHRRSRPRGRFTPSGDANEGWLHQQHRMCLSLKGLQDWLARACVSTHLRSSFREDTPQASPSATGVKGDPWMPQATAPQPQTGDTDSMASGSNRKNLAKQLGRSTPPRWPQGPKGGASPAGTRSRRDSASGGARSSGLSPLGTSTRCTSTPVRWSPEGR